MSKTIALLGNSNVGKTTFFNSITGCNNHVGNFAGVTVEGASKYVEKLDCNIVDLPGIYSLSCFSLEEQVAKDFLATKPDIVINIVEASSLQRNLYLTMQLLKLNIKCVLVVNMYDELVVNGGSIDIASLGKMLGIPIYKCDARKKGAAFDIVKNAIIHSSVGAKYDFEDNDFFQQVCNTYKVIEKIVKSCYNAPIIKKNALQKLLYGKCGIIIFIAVFIAALYLSFGEFGVGAFFSSQLANASKLVFTEISNVLIVSNAPTWAVSFICDAIFDGVVNILVFLPQVVMFFLLLSFLEDSGYVAYIGFMFDGIMRRVGLDGKSIFTLLFAFGCNTTAMQLCGNLNNKRLLKRTILLVPFVPCSAKAPVFISLIALCKMSNLSVFVIILLLYFLSILLCFIVARIAHLIDSDTVDDQFILEMPPIRKPQLKRVIKVVGDNILSFFARVATVIMVVAVIIWTLKNFDFSMQFLQGSNIEQSILANLGNMITTLLSPLGIFDWKIGICLLMGLVAKESVASAMLMLYRGDISFDNSMVLTLLIVILLYSPCVASIGMIKAKCGYRTAFMSILLNCSVAYLVALINSMIFYKLNLDIALQLLLLVALIIIAYLLCFVLQYKSRKNRCKSCNKGKDCGTFNCKKRC